MLDPRFVFIYGVLHGLGIVFGAHFPVGEKRSGLVLSLLLTATWLVYISAWTSTPVGPALGLLNRDVWQFDDCFVGVVALALGYRRWWGWAIWSGAMTFEMFHQAYVWGLWDFEAYSYTMDKVLLLQLAVFLIVGGPGIGARISDIARWGGNVLRAPSAASAQTRARARR